MILKIFGPLLVSFSVVYGAFLPRVAVNKAASGWGAIEVSPNAYLSATYRNNFRVSVYKSNSTTAEAAQYYYSPALILERDTVRCAFNQATKNHEVIFWVKMWDPEFEMFVQDKIALKSGVYVPASNIRVLPVEEIRIDASSGSFTGFEIANKWYSYASQPSRFGFRLYCKTNEECIRTAGSFRENPLDFLHDLAVSYSLTAQKSSRKSIQITASHFKSGDRFNKLQQQLPGKDTVYLTADDFNKMTLEIANNIMITEVVDDEFVSQDQAVTVAGLLERAMNLQHVSSSTFDDRMWESVFWEQENARPDKVTNTLNEFYSKGEDRLKTYIKEAVSQSSSSTSGGGGSVGFLGLFSVGGSGGHTSSSVFNSLNEEQFFNETIRQAQSKSQWSGERFEPKALLLSRINMAALTQSTTITSVQVRITKTTAELSSQINLLPADLLVTGFDAVADFECDGERFLFSRDWRTWGDAGVQCNNIGGRLAVVNTRRIWECVLAKIRPFQVNTWLGLSKSSMSETPATWQWSNGIILQPNHFAAWVPGQPDNWSPPTNPASGQSCAYAEAAGESDWLWDDTSCLYVTPYVCQVPSGVSMGNGLRGTA